MMSIFFIFSLIIFFIFFACLAWRNLVWAITILIALLPTYLIRFHVGPIPMTMLEGMILVLFIVWTIKLLRERQCEPPPLQKEGWGGFLKSLFFRKGRKIENPSSILPLEKGERLTIGLAMTKWWPTVLLWIAVAAAAMFISPDLRAAAGIWKAYFIEPIIFFIIFISVIKTEKDKEKIFWALGASALVISIFAIYQKFTGFAIPNPTWQVEATRRVTSFFGYPNAVGLYLAPIVALYVGWIIENCRITHYARPQRLTSSACDGGRALRITILRILVVSAAIAAIIFARSEGAYMGIAAGCFFLGLLTKKLRWPTLIFTAIMALVIFFTPQLKSYVIEKATLSDTSGKIRVTMWQETIKMLKDRPTWGAGLAGYQKIVAPYHKARHIEVYLYPHNIFLNFWSEIGVFGLLIFLWILIKFFKSTFYALRVTRYALPITLSAVMITLLVHGLVDVTYFKNDLAVFFWMVVGLGVVSENLRQNRQNLVS